MLSVYADLFRQEKRKLDDRVVECFLVGYVSQTKGYRLWNPEKADVLITKYVQFAEDKISYEWIYKDSAIHRYKYNRI